MYCKGNFFIEQFILQHHKIDVFRHAFCIILSMYGDLSRIFLIFVCNENDYSY